jgi:plasmid maintenance system killer protein
LYYGARKSGQAEKNLSRIEEFMGGAGQYSIRINEQWRICFE